MKKPKVGIVGEILVKFSPLANNHIVELLESEGAEAVMPDLMDFPALLLLQQQFQGRKLRRQVFYRPFMQHGHFPAGILPQSSPQGTGNQQPLHPASPDPESGQYGQGFRLLGQSDR